MEITEIAVKGEDAQQEVRLKRAESVEGPKSVELRPRIVERIQSRVRM